MLNLFIDTNIFLSFFHSTSDDLEELKKLSALVDTKEILLLLPDQVKAEFYRNRAGKIFDAMRKLREAKFNLQIPVFAKDYQEFTQLRALMEKTEALHTKLIQNIMTDVELERLKADAIISALFSKGRKIAVSDALYLKALRRVQLGHPPGKNGSMGDAVNWECLLSVVPKKADIYVVTGDKDFRSQLLEDKVNEYLYDEWWEEKSAFTASGGGGSSTSHMSADNVP